MHISSFWNPSVTPDDPQPYRVLIERNAWADKNRSGRMVPFKAYYPEGVQEPVPLIIWSHGLGGSRDGAGFLARYLAGYGYGVLNLSHAGTDSSLWEGKPGHPWDVIRSTHIPRKASLQRFQDISFVISQVLSRALPFEVDADRIGMSGHSFGALTTQMIAGQSVVSKHHRYALEKLPIRAGILYSPVPVLKYGATPSDSYKTIHMPLMHWTGTDDVSPIEGFGYERRLSIFEHAGASDQHLFILKDGDHMVYNGSRGQLGENNNRALHETLIKIGSLAWWDWHLKDDLRAKEWLTQKSFIEFSGNTIEYRSK